MTITGILTKTANIIGAVLVGADGITPPRTDRADETRPARASGAGGAR